MAVELRFNGPAGRPMDLFGIGDAGASEFLNDDAHRAGSIEENRRIRQARGGVSKVAILHRGKSHAVFSLIPS
jgi:hypothetical protein